MLKRLYISNFALIEEMEVGFPGGLTVITGETGAGKSIFLEALALSLGKRADLTALRDKKKKCVVEAVFVIRELGLQAVFADNDIDYDEEIVLRREISAEGKSRSFLNDTPVALNVLKTLSEKLIDIHSQHQTLLLNQENFQLGLLDAFAGSGTLLTQYKSAYTSLSALNRKLTELQEQENTARKELDYFKFIFNELEEAAIKPGSLKALEEESATHENAESIQTALAQASAAISGGEFSILGALNPVRQSLLAVSKYNSDIASFHERINSVCIELKDLSGEIANAEGAVVHNPARLEEINGRLDAINRLLMKHGVSDEAGLLKVKEETGARLNTYGSLEEEIADTRKKIAVVSDECTKLGKQLSALRKNAVAGIEEQVHTMLAGLGMEKARFSVALTTNAVPAQSGFDQVTFLFSANKGSDMQALHKTASGGELSRLMLSLKALLATRKKLPVIIFDEIDSGVSGRVADQIGSILVKMGAGMQVVAITHLAQIASKGGHHLFVYKNENEDKTLSHIRELKKPERVNEIAKMLSAGDPSQAALKNAKELLASGETV